MVEGKIPDSKGFTLIELVTVIMIAAILSAVAGMGLVQIANGYVFARENAAAAQKAQVALARLARELSSIKSISSATAASLTYQRENDATHLIETHTLSWAGADQPITLDGDALVDKVRSLSLTYRDAYNKPASAYSSATEVIELTFTLKGYDGTPLTFIERVVI
jgi:prepilin-type N-terminal cleavage/methylation domain-containing protein